MQVLDFYNTFEIPKILAEVPGRDIDENGDICSWYTEYKYPDIESVYFDLLDYHNELKEELRVINLTRDNLVKVLLLSLLDIFNKLNDKKKEDMKKDIQMIFEVSNENT